MAKHEPGLYKNAVLLKKQKDTPRKYKSLVKDDDENDGMLEAIENRMKDDKNTINNGK